MLISKEEMPDLPQKKEYPGVFIAVEGLDGAGKTSLMAVLRQLFQKHRIENISTREPGGTPFAENIRNIFKSDLCKDVDNTAHVLLVTAARIDHVQKVILPGLMKGRTVVTDRYVLSTLSFQGMAPNNLWLCMLGMQNVVPDFTIYLDVSYDKSQERMRDARMHELSTHGDWLDASHQEEQERRAGRYAMGIASPQLAGNSVIVLDANQDFAGVKDQLETAFYTTILPVIEKRRVALESAT